MGMKRFGWLCITTLVAALVTFGCAREEDAGTESPVVIETSPVARADITAQIATEGIVVAPPNEYAAIECSYCAPVSRVFATVGQSLKEGDVIVELSHPDARAAVAAAETELSQARAALASAEQQYTADVEDARTELSAASAIEREAREALQDAREQSPPPENLGELEVHFEQANQRRVRLEERVEAARARSEEALEPHRRRISAAEQDLAAAQADRQMAMIESPIDGILIELNVGPGDQPGQIGKPLAVVADLATLRVHATVSGAQAEQISPGLPASITIASVPNVIFRGQVERLNTVIGEEASGDEGERAYIAIIPFRNERGAAKPEMRANVTLELGTANDVLVVPAEAVEVDDDGEPFVSVQVGEQWEPRYVVTGLSDGMFTEIRSGVEEGEVVRVQMQVAPTTD
jgi:multidrug efflux pump subunit AcrA (membrane-fusion protein)